MLRATTACTLSISQLPKVVQTLHCFRLWTWKYASRHNGVYFFDIPACKSGPNPSFFYIFDVKMCFAPQRRALFLHIMAKNGHFPTVSKGFLIACPEAAKLPKIWLQKAPGQDLAKNGRFPMVPKGLFNCLPRSCQIVKIWLQKAPGQDLAKNGHFPMVPEGFFNCLPRRCQIPKIWLQKAPGQELAKNSHFPMVPKGFF